MNDGTLKMNFAEVELLSEVYKKNYKLISELLNEFCDETKKLVNTGAILGASEEALTKCTSSIQVLRMDLNAANVTIDGKIQKAHEETLQMEQESARQFEALFASDPVSFYRPAAAEPIPDPAPTGPTTV